MTYFASRNYRIVCMEGCYHVRNIALYNLITYETLEEALEDGCRPCKHCLGKDDDEDDFN